VITRLLLVLSLAHSPAILSGCRKTSGSDESTRSQTAGQATSEPSRGSQARNSQLREPESKPESEPESGPATAETEGEDPGQGRWVYRHSIGTSGQKPGQFREPVGLAVTPGGDIFVSDAGNERMQKLSATGESLAVFADGIGRPMHLSWSGMGHLVVAVFLEDRIRLFDDTDESESFGGDWLDAPAAAAQAKDGRFYVADFYHHQFHIVSRDGKRLKSVGEEGGADGHFTYPTDIALDRDGNVWVADAYAHRLQKFDAEGRHLETIGGRGTAAGRFEIATGIDIGPDGLVYVADFDNSRVQILAPDGTPRAILDPDDVGDRAIERPTDIVATGLRLYVLDHGHHQVDIWELR